MHLPLSLSQPGSGDKEAESQKSRHFVQTEQPTTEGSGLSQLCPSVLPACLYRSDAALGLKQEKGGEPISNS